MPVILLTVDQKHMDEKDSQVVITISGSAKAIKRQLLEIAHKLQNDYKPTQGTSIYSDCTVSISTPIWEGTHY